MATNKKTEKQTTDTPTEMSKPFVLRLTDKPYYLTKELLLKESGNSLSTKERWDYISYTFISFENDILKFKAKHSSWEKEIHIRIAPDKLIIQCSCESQSEILCFHCLKALIKIIDYEGEDYFERYSPQGMITTGYRYPQFFKKELSGIDLKFIPKENLGSTHLFTNKNSLPLLNNLLALQGPSYSRNAPNLNTEITFLLMHPYNHIYKTPAFLLPCLGLKNKAGTDVKAFEKFLSGAEKSYEPNLTEEQKMLNTFCYDMWKQAEKTNRFFLKNNDEDCNKLKELFGIWEKVIPLLYQQKYVFRHPFFRTRYLKHKPFKRYTHRIVINKERPQLFFQLTDKGFFYQLILKVNIKNKIVTKFNSDITFFIAVNDYYYLVSSLMDAGILEWMEEHDNRITIFKEHFPEFEKTCLNQLKEYYPIEYR